MLKPIQKLCIHCMDVQKVIMPVIPVHNAEIMQISHSNPCGNSALIDCTDVQEVKQQIFQFQNLICNADLNVKRDTIKNENTSGIDR